MLMKDIFQKIKKTEMKTIKEYGPQILPDFVLEHDVLRQVKSKRTSGFKKFKYKSLNAPDLKVTYAGLGIRSMATFIDLLIIVSLLLIPEIFLFSFNFNDLDLNSYRFFIGIGLWVFYHSTFESSA